MVSTCKSLTNPFLKCMNVWPWCLDGDAVNVSLIPPAKISHLPSWCIVSLLMSKFVHCICGHTFWITPLHLFVIWFDLSLPVFFLLFLFSPCFSAIRIMNLRSSKTKLEGPLFPHNAIFHLLPHMNKSGPKSIQLPLWIISVIYCGVFSHVEGRISVHTALLS